MIDTCTVIPDAVTVDTATGGGAPAATPDEVPPEPEKFNSVSPSIETNNTPPTVARPESNGDTLTVQFCLHIF